jgi:hypothetical protein
MNISAAALGSRRISLPSRWDSPDACGGWFHVHGTVKLLARCALARQVGPISRETLATVKGFKRDVLT